MISRTLRTVLFLFPAMIVAGCETPPARGSFPELTYNHLPAYSIDVASIEIEEAYQSPRTDPHVEHLYPMTPAMAARHWAEDRMRAVGIDGTVRFIVLDARSIEHRLIAPPSGYGTEPLDRYDMRIAVRIELLKAAGRTRAFVTADVSLQQYVDPSTSLNDRERIWFANVEALMRSLNAELDPRIAAAFGPYLR